MGTCLGHKANKGQEHRAGSVLRFHVCYWKPSRAYLSPEVSSDGTRSGEAGGEAVLTSARTQAPYESSPLSQQS